ncbi:PBP1A family penicillin-binding protein [Xylanibacillus composti]|uniref:Penicillin-binding protein 1F n=1 Tax=Xylanibacillus composti TaxID=1572762 RepID=A0A8J4H157_9BACL|nr:PBP1A family penicillin-binding protein [Xylanibacillus composti]MDT9725582.1 PBP1A family penicillin-binding protein [Xylanibacillus composti]GIQ67675.1 penicillin-binding protein 1F [Xylanibacillus composti]
MAKPKQKKKKTPLSRWIVRMGVLSLLAVIGAVSLYVAILVSGHQALNENMKMMEMAESSIILDARDEEIKRLFRENRVLVSFDDIPDLVKHAFIATEDKRFEEHAGIDYWSIGRAIVKDIMQGSLVEGGSTITQQLAKNMFTNAERTFFRKAKEASLALALENRFTKDEILEMYLNRIFFGGNLYGIGVASEYYFNKEVSELELWEIATLAAMPKGPNTYNPIADPVKSKERRAVVLKLMLDQGYITQAQHDEAVRVEYVEPKRSADKEAYWSYVDVVLGELERKAGLTADQVFFGGYRIYTNLDVKTQRVLESKFKNEELFPKGTSDDIMQGAMVVLDHHDGRILGVMGGRDYQPRGWNRATVKRQPGSSFKPIVSFAPAIEDYGYTPYSLLPDERMSFGDYSPRNYNQRYLGEVTMMKAVEDSINVPAVWLLNEIGVANGMAFAEKLGIELDKQNDRNLAIALGGLTYGATPIEMAEAYAAFANHGIWNEAFTVRKVETRDGHILYEHKPNTKRVMSEQTAYYMTRMLERVVHQGTGTNARMQRPSAGKTGSTQPGVGGVDSGNAYWDVWFVGYTPEVTASVWMGYDARDKEHIVTSGSFTPAKMFAEVLTESLADRQIVPFTKPEGVEDLAKRPPGVQDLQVFPDELEPKVLLSWSSVQGADGYRVYRKASGEEEFTLITTTPVTEIQDLTVLPGETYTYVVRVYQTGNPLESNSSSQVTVTVPDQSDTLPDIDLDDILNPGGGEEENESELPEDANGGMEPGVGEPIEGEFPDEDELHNGGEQHDGTTEPDNGNRNQERNPQQANGNSREMRELEEMIQEGADVP